MSEEPSAREAVFHVRDSSRVRERYKLRWTRRVLPPGPIRLFHAAFIAIVTGTYLETHFYGQFYRRFHAQNSRTFSTLKFLCVKAPKTCHIKMNLKVSSQQHLYYRVFWDWVQVTPAISRSP